MTKLTAQIFLLAACTSSNDPASDVVAELRAKQPMIDRVQFDTATSIPANSPPQVVATATGDAARAIYAATLALPILPPGEYNCPANFGIIYNLTFTTSGESTIVGTATPTGCEIVTLNAEIGSASLSINGAYWRLLASDLGIDESTIFPYTPPTATSEP